MFRKNKIFILVWILCLLAFPVWAGEINAESDGQIITSMEPALINDSLQQINTNSSLSESESDHVPGEFIVMFRPSINVMGGESNFQDSHVKSLAENIGVEIVSTYPALSKQAGQIFALVRSDAKPESEMLEELRSNPEVLGVTLNYKTRAFSTPNDKYYSNLWGIKAINAESVWDEGYTGSQNIYVAVLDTGISYTHEDLAANFESHTYSKNFATTSTTYSDSKGHGSHVAGTIAGVGNNGIGVAGVNWQAKLISLKVLGDDGKGSFSWTVNALNYLCEILDDHPEINLASINLSLGGYINTTPQSIKNNPIWAAFKAFSDKNKAVICVAAGNENVKVGEYDSTEGGYAYPASFIGIDNMIVVAAADNNSSYSRSSFSNYSTEYVDVAAPGRSIYSTIPNNSYANYSGTSMATPHVAGAAALLRSIFPNTTAKEIKSAIINGANKKYANDYTKYGFLDVNGAKNILAGSTPTPVKLPPSIITDSLPDAIVNQPYSETLSASGSDTITWALDGNSNFPAGMSLSATGKLSGTPTKAGTYNFTVIAMNSYGSSSKSLTLTVKNAANNDKAPEIQTTYLSDGSIQEFYSENLSAAGTSPITWQISSGTLPNGLTLNSSTGAITGAPSKSGTFSFTVSASNSAGHDEKNYSLKIAGIAPKIVTLKSLRSAELGKSYSEKIYALGTGPIKWSVSSGSLPAGLTLDSSTGTISGTPIRASLIPYRFDITASNSEGSDTVYFSLYVDDTSTTSGIKILTETLPYSCYNVPYSAKLEATGSNITWSITEGSLPSGIKLNSDGTITGTGPDGGDFAVIKVKAANSTDSVEKHLTFRYTSLSDLQRFTRESLPDGLINQSYNKQLYMIGYSPFYFSITDGELPPGLVLNKSGYITGTPTKTGSYTFTVMGTYYNSGWGLYDEKKFTLIIRNSAQKPSITTVNLPNGINGIPYNAGFTYSGTDKISWSVSGSLPPGLYLAGDGDLISGTPTKAGTYTFTVYANNSAGSASKSITLTINNIKNHKILNDSYLGTYKVDDYCFKLFNADEVASWTHTGGTLPDGLTLYSTGLLLGIFEKAGSFEFTITATFDDGESVSKIFKLVVTKKENNTPPVINSDSVLDSGVDGESYYYALKATGSGTLTWSLISGKLPDGLNINSSGIITGTPTKTGTFKFNAQVSSSFGKASKKFTISIKAAAPSITTTALENAKIGENYNAEIKANGTQTLKWSLSSGKLPKGLKLNSSKGTIYGSPTESGSFTFTIKAANSAGNDSKSFTLKVIDTDPVVISPVNLTNAKAGEPYSFNFTASGPSSITWTIAGGKLPSGIKLNKKTGILSGTPTKLGEFYFTLKAAGKYSKDSKSFTLKVIDPDPVVINPVNLTNAKAGESYLFNFTASGPSSITWTIAGGKLPAGLKLNKKTGVLSGKPSQSGEFNFTLKAAGKYSNNSKSFTLRVTPVITTSKLPDSVYNKSYNSVVKVYGKTSNLNWKIVKGSLPDGVKLNESNGKISGKLTGTGTYNFTVRVQVEDLSPALYAEASYTVNINGIAPKISTKSLSKGVINKNYSAAIKTSGSMPMTLNISGLPDGLALNYDSASGIGTISGTPAECGTFSVQLTAANDTEQTSKTFNLVVSNVKPSIISSSLPDATVGQNYFASIEANGSAKGDSLSYNLEWAGNSKIDGFVLNDSDASITGTPAEISGKTYNNPGSYKVKVTVKNSAGSVSKVFTIKLNAAPAINEDVSDNISDSDNLPSDKSTSQTGTQEKLSFPENFAGNNSGLTAGDIAEIDGKKYIIAAVLAPVKASESGQYDFDISLSSKAKTGEKLIWFACPYDSESSTDDEIADFYDETGKEIFAVPESHLITVSPWLREGVIYEPLILVEIVD